MGPFRSCWNGTTSALQPEEITLKGTRVSYVYYIVIQIKRLIYIYIYIYIYHIYQPLPIRKKSGNLFSDPRIYVGVFE